MHIHDTMQYMYTRVYANDERNVSIRWQEEVLYTAQCILLCISMYIYIYIYMIPYIYTYIYIHDTMACMHIHVYVCVFLCVNLMVVYKCVGMSHEFICLCVSCISCKMKRIICFVYKYVWATNSFVWVCNAYHVKWRKSCVLLESIHEYIRTYIHACIHAIIHS
jgi:hypothetical protein